MWITTPRWPTTTTMLEILLLGAIGGALSKRLRGKGRSAAWAALLVPLYLGCVVFGYVTGGWMAYAVGAAIGIFAACAIVELLPAGEPHLWQSDDTLAGQKCPHCGSLQTELYAGRIQCFACDGRPKPTVPANSPNSPFV